MNKKQIISECSKQTKLPQKLVKNVIVAFEETVIKYLNIGENICINGVGKFFIKTIPARTIINNFTGEQMVLGQKFSVAFRSSKKLCSQIK